MEKMLMDEYGYSYAEAVDIVRLYQRRNKLGELWDLLVAKRTISLAGQNDV